MFRGQLSIGPGGFQLFLVEGVDAGPRSLFELRYLHGRGNWLTAPGGLHPSRRDEAVLGGDGILDAGAFAFACEVSVLWNGDEELIEVVRGLGSFVGVAIWEVVFGCICG